MWGTSTYIHIYIHTYTHTYIHTYIHAYIHTQVWRQMVQVFKTVNLPQRYIGVHARYGDKKVEAAPQRMESYFMAVCTVAKATGISDVYLATDSTGFIQDFSKTSSVSKGYNGWTCAQKLRIYYNTKCSRTRAYHSPT
jgi:hypothetical protein